MNYCDRERNRILNELEMVSHGANQMRLLLAKEDLDADARERAERVLGRQKRDIKMLSTLLVQIDAGVSALLKAWRSRPVLTRHLCAPACPLLVYGRHPMTHLRP